MTEEKEFVGIRVSVPLVKRIIELMGWNPNTPYNYAVDFALRELMEKLEEEKRVVKKMEVEK